jgi:exo-1,4-beta-D-glucosaminidase
VAVVNDRHVAAKGLTVTARVLDLNLRETFSKTQTIDVAPDGVVRAFTIPQPPPDPVTTYFVRLTLADSSGAPVSTNFYWLSSRPDELDWAGTKWYYTPTKRHADLTALTRLPATRLAIATESSTAEGNGDARVVVVENTGTALAFQIHLELVDADSGEELLPVFWDANYFELLPGETRRIHVSYPRQPGVTGLRVEAEAWNVPRAAYDVR